MSSFENPDDSNGGWISPEDYDDAVSLICQQIKLNIDAGHYESVAGIKFDVKKVCQNHWMTATFKYALQVLLHSGNSTKSNNFNGSYEYSAIDSHVMDSAMVALQYDVLKQLENLEDLMPQFICVDCKQTVNHVDDVKRCPLCAKSFKNGKHWGIWYNGDPESDDPTETPGWCVENLKPEFYMYAEEAEDRMNSYWKVDTDNAHKFSVHLRLPSGSHTEWVLSPKGSLQGLIEEKLKKPVTFGEIPEKVLKKTQQSILEEVLEEVIAEEKEEKKIEDSLAIFD